MLAFQRTDGVHEDTKKKRSEVFVTPLRFFSNSAALVRRLSAVGHDVLVAVVVWFKRSIHWHIDLGGLLWSELGQLHTEFFKVQPRDFLIHFLGQHMHSNFEPVGLRPESNLCKHLICKTGAHYE